MTEHIALLRRQHETALSSADNTQSQHNKIATPHQRKAAAMMLRLGLATQVNTDPFM